MRVSELLDKPSETKIKELNQLIKQGRLDLKQIEKEIFYTSNLHLIFLAGLYIEGINIGRASHIIARSLEGYYIVNFAYFIMNQNFETKDMLLKDLANGIKKSKEARFMYYYAKMIINAPIADIVSSILKTNDSVYIYYTLRDIPKLDLETKIKLARRIIELKEASYIVGAAKLVPYINSDEYAIGLLNAQVTLSYGTYICRFLEEHSIQNTDILNKLIEALISTNDIMRIVKLLKGLNEESSQIIIKALLNNCLNYSDPNFWLNCIIPLATSKCECANYATERIIKSGNIEFITIASYYMEDQVLKAKLKNSLRKVPNLNDAYEKANISDKVISRVLTSQKSGNNIAS